MSAIKLYQIDNIDDLQIFGSYQQVKKSVQVVLGFSIKSRDMADLLLTIQTMKAAVLQEKNQFQDLISDETNIKALGNFTLVKKQLSTKLGIKLPARSWQQLTKRLTKIITAFTPADDKKPHLSYEAKIAYYEKNKIKNFITSSKLEGLNLTNHNFNVDELVKKHTQTNPRNSTVNNG